MTAAAHDFTIRQGETFSRTLTYKDAAGALVNLTGYSARMSVRKRDGQAVVATAATTLGGAAGTISLSISAALTAGLRPDAYEYDLFLTSGGGVCEALLAGKFIVERAVSLP